MLLCVSLNLLLEFSYQKRKQKKGNIWHQCLFLHIYMNSDSCLSQLQENNVIINNHVLVMARIVPLVRES